MPKFRLLPLAALAVAAVAATAFAQDITITTDPALAELAPAAMIEKRQELMRANGALLRSVGGLTGADAVAAAETLIANYSNFTVLFPEGTEAGSKALPAVWQNKEAFNAIFLQGVEHATALKAAAEAGDAAAYEAANRAIGATCGQCHQQFRS